MAQVGKRIPFETLHAMWPDATPQARLPKQVWLKKRQLRRAERDARRMNRR